MMSPGHYLCLRRRAARLSIDDVAAQVRTAPHLGEIDRVAWIDRIEQDVATISPDVRIALGKVFSFSSQALQQLINLRSYGPGEGRPVPRLCLICGCSEHDPCIGRHGVTCAWWGQDSCTFCTVPPAEKIA